MSERRWTEHHVITVLTEDGVARYESDVPMRELTIEGPPIPWPSHEPEEDRCVFCGEPGEFEDGLRCKLCAEEQDD